MERYPLKLWKVRNNIDVKTFILELFVIKVLTDNKFDGGLEKNIVHFWEFARDKVDSLKLEDPANPTGNDLGKILSDAMKADLKAAAKSALKKIEQEDGWYTVFGESKPDTKVTQSAAYVSPNIIRPKPYCWTDNDRE